MSSYKTRAGDEVTIACDPRHAQARDPLLRQSRWCPKWPEMRPCKGGNFLTRELNEAEEALIGFVPRSPPVSSVMQPF